MTRYQEDKLSMWAATHGLLHNHIQIWATLPALAAAIEQFSIIRQEVNQQIALQQSAIEGITEDKWARQKELIAATQQIANNIEAYAMNEMNATLQKQFHFTPSFFKRLRDNALPIVVGNVIATATDMGAALVPYGTTAERIQNIKDKLTAYTAANANPRVAIGQRRIATLAIIEKMEQGMRQLSIIDKLIGNFDTTYPDFVAAYHSVRMTITAGRHHKNTKNSNKAQAAITNVSTAS